MKQKIMGSFALNLLSSGLFFAFNFTIAKIIGANEYGKITFYLSFIQFFILVISLNYEALYMGSRIIKNNDRTFDIFISFQTLLFLIFFVPAYVIISFYIDNTQIIFLILMIALLQTHIVTIGLEYNSQKEISKSILYSLLAPRVLIIAFFCVFILLGFGDSADYLYAYLTSLFAILVLFGVKKRPKMILESHILRRAWKFYLLGIIGASFTYIAQIAQKVTGSYEELAAFGIAMLLILGLSMVGTILIKYALPKLHEAWKDKNIAKISKLYSTHTYLSSVVNLPILIFILLYIQRIADYMGSGYEALPIIFYILSIGYLFDLLTGITGTILRVTDNENIEIYNEIARLVSGLVLLYMFWNQSYGPAYALSGSLIIYNLLKYFQIYRIFKIYSMTLPHFAIIVFSLAIYALVLYTVSNSFCWLCGIFVIGGYYFVMMKKAKKEVTLEIYR